MKVTRKRRKVTTCRYMPERDRIVPRTRRFFSIDDIAEIADFVRTQNEDGPACSKDIALSIANHYYNLEAIPVGCLIYQGTVESTHWVNITSDGQYIIDATGDRFGETNFAEYRNQVTPWIFVRSGSKRTYFSTNHLPMIYPDMFGTHFNDIDIVLQTRSPFCKQTRCICI